MGRAQSRPGGRGGEYDGLVGIELGTSSPGVLTFAGAPSSGTAIAADFSYYWPVRIALHFPEAVQGVEVGHDLNPLPAFLPHGFGFAFEFLVRQPVEQRVGSDVVTRCPCIPTGRSQP
jgi:hypothetical protein